MQPSALWILIAAAAFCASCQTAAPRRVSDVTTAPTATLTPAPSPSAEEPSDEIIVTTRENLPESLHIDGALSEWGLPPRQRGAESQLAVVLTKTGLALAGDLGKQHEAGIWLAIGFPAPDLTALPLGFNNTGGFTLLECDPEAPGGPTTPEDQEDCRAKLAAADAFAAEQRARFRRVYRIDAQGVRRADGAALSPVDDARAAFVRHAEGVTVELTLPERALPRASTAPLDLVALFVSAADEPMPVESEAEPWPLYPIAAITFEPYGALRNAVFAEALPLLSYQPGEQLDIEQIGYGDAVISTERRAYRGTLCESAAKTAKVEYCLVRAKDTALVVLEGSKPLSTTWLDTPPRASRLRGDDLHIYLLWEDDFAYEVTGNHVWTQAGWSVTVARPDGTVTDAIMQGEPPIYWADPEPFDTAELDTFGLRGFQRSEDDFDKIEKVEVTWKLQRDGSYRMNTRQLK